MAAQASGGGRDEFWEWAARGVYERIAAEPSLVHFKGHDAIVYIGAGLEPFRERFRLTARFSAGVMIVPGTGEKIIRFTVGPQIQFRRRSNE